MIRGDKNVVLVKIKNGRPRAGQVGMIIKKEYIEILGGEKYLIKFDKKSGYYDESDFTII